MDHYTTQYEQQEILDNKNRARGMAGNAGLETFDIPPGKQLCIYLRSKKGYAKINTGEFSWMRPHTWKKTKVAATKLTSFSKALEYLNTTPRNKHLKVVNLKMWLEISFEVKKNGNSYS